MFATRCWKSDQCRRLGRRLSRHVAALEALESRVLLSGTVTVAVSGHNLLITGDGQDNDIVITGSDNSLAVTSGNNTTVIGAYTITGTIGKVVIALKGGNDTVTFNGATFGSLQNRTTCPVSIDGAAGDNTILLTDTKIFGAFTVTNADGFDSFTTSGDTLVLGAISINNGAGGGAMYFQEGFVAGSNVTITTGAQTINSIAYFSNVSIAGNVSVTNGNGIIQTVLFNSCIGGKTTLTNGVGTNETVVVSGCTLGKGLAIATTGATSIDVVNNKIGGDLTITANATTGADALVALTSSIVSGNVTCTVGNAKSAAPLFAASTITLSGVSLFNKNFTLNAAAQSNNISIIALQLAGAAKVACATGYNTATITDVSIAGNVAFTSAGTGCDTLIIDGAIGGNLAVTSANNATTSDSLTVSSLTVGGNLSAKTGSGADAITGIGLVVHGTTNLQTGDGDDVTKIDDSVFVGALTFLGGNGNNQILIETASDAQGSSLTVFQAAVSLKVGNGANSVTVGESGSVGRKALFLGPLTLVGGTGTNHLTTPNFTWLQYPSLKGFTLV
jgi:hypothetical protein